MKIEDRELFAGHSITTVTFEEKYESLRIDLPGGRHVTVSLDRWDGYLNLNFSDTVAVLPEAANTLRVMPVRR